MKKAYQEPKAKSKRLINTMLLAGSTTAISYGGEARIDIPALSRERNTSITNLDF